MAKEVIEVNHDGGASYDALYRRLERHFLAGDWPAEVDELERRALAAREAKRVIHRAKFEMVKKFARDMGLQMLVEEEGRAVPRFTVYGEEA